MRLLAKWPVDKNKSRARNLKLFLESEVNRLHNPRITENPEQLEDPLSGKNVKHEANMRALQEIIDNKYQQRWPTDHFKTGLFGLTQSHLAKVNADKFRFHLGLGATRWNFWKTYFEKKPE
ncbi:unnamed protein product [Bursaphelenchus xylophilus]|uniref:(pine wood nematode) hypothetical protein n=1 Tax=Bursaphelenchus xylophilus TaxID=6326 RepID=A0A1I7RI50_BURXY|nr:unnamed protein product [Bursaphelenchus xylophilus]CAG9115155.1 unnamed protein product [Bursaphelenchus xylophilus]